MIGRQPRRKANRLVERGALAGLLILGVAGWLGAHPATPQSGQSSSSTQSSAQGQSQQGQQARQEKKNTTDKPQADKTTPAAQPTPARRVYSNGTGSYYEAPAAESRPAASSPDSAASSPSSPAATDERRMQRIWQASPATPAAAPAGKSGAAASPTTKAGATAAGASQSPSAAQAPQAGQPAQPASPQSGATSSAQAGTRTYSYTDGTNTYYETVGTARATTRNGDVVNQQARSSNEPGVRPGEEVITRNLADGTVETETIIKGEDEAGHQVPVGRVIERQKKSGDKTTIEREIMNSDGEGRWNTTQKEQVNETGTDQNRKTVKQILQPDISGSWKVVDSEEMQTKTAKDGTSDSHTVRKMRDPYDRLSDYEIKDEHAATKDGKETREVTLRRREASETDHPNFFLVNRTVETKTPSADGKTVTKHTTTYSDQLPDSSYRDVESYQPRVVQETTEVTTKGPDGEKTVKEVKQRDVANPNDLKPAYKVVQQTDKDGNVKQVYIPAEQR